MVDSGGASISVVQSIFVFKGKVTILAAAPVKIYHYASFNCLYTIDDKNNGEYFERAYLITVYPI